MLELEGTGVGVSNVVFPALNTPIYDHSLNRIGARAKPPPPIYDVSIAAKAILKAIRGRPIRIVPGFTQGKLAMAVDFAIPWLGKAVMSVIGERVQKRKEPAPASNGNFWKPLPEITGPRGTLRATPAWKRYAPLLLLATPAALARVFLLRRRRVAA